MIVFKAINFWFNVIITRTSIKIFRPFNLVSIVVYIFIASLESCTGCAFFTLCKYCFFALDIKSSVIIFTLRARFPLIPKYMHQFHFQTVIPRSSTIIRSSLLVENRFVRELKHFFPKETMVSILIRFTQNKNT